eukprot:NODE_1703_length_1079_cov_223.135742.p11 GENE.NODE_1703_length_1079_cov_223.135742~~NODE_1703_length_1079_cov_223.135742.p11  ORF type:complete len:58 (+),score=9.55 NODE_1703_length_1079_cov_223.135742:789-962(+)
METRMPRCGRRHMWDEGLKDDLLEGLESQSGPTTANKCRQQAGRPWWRTSKPCMMMF